MDRLLVDTNIVLDLLARRQEFIIEAQELFTLSDKKELKLYVSSLTFANTYYILSQKMKLDNARKILRKFKVLVEVLPMDDKIIDLSLESDFKDFEDTIQYHTAIENCYYDKFNKAHFIAVVFLVKQIVHYSISS